MTTPWLPLPPESTKSHDLRFKSVLELSESEPVDKTPAWYFFTFMIGELAATELCAANIYQFDDMPWSFHIDMATQMFDEARHTRINEKWYLSFEQSLDIYQGVNIYYDVYINLSLASRLARLCLSDELNALSGQSRRMKQYMDEGMTEKARSTERILHDEIRHVGYGIKWLKYLSFEHGLSVKSLLKHSKTELDSCLTNGLEHDGKCPKPFKIPSVDVEYIEALDMHEELSAVPGRPPLPATLMRRAGLNDDEMNLLAHLNGQVLEETDLYLSSV